MPRKKSKLRPRSKSDGCGKKAQFIEWTIPTTTDRLHDERNFIPTYEHGRILVLLLEYDANIPTGHKTSMFAYIFRAILGRARPARILQRRPKDSTLLDIACDMGNSATAELLLKYGADVNASTNIFTQTFYKYPPEDTFSVYDDSENVFARKLLDAFSGPNTIARIWCQYSDWAQDNDVCLYCRSVCVCSHRRSRGLTPLSIEKNFDCQACEDALRRGERIQWHMDGT